MLADMLAGRAASLRLREYFGAEDFAGPHYRPDDPGEPVGQRHRDEAGRLFRQKRAEPAGERAFAVAHATQQRSYGENKQFSDVAVSLLADAAERLLAAT
jgi:hypothetical protein